MRIRDKIITATCRTENGIEWTCQKVKPDGVEAPEQGCLPLSIPDDLTEGSLDQFQLPPELAEHLKGDITVAVRTSELLMRTMKFPTADPGEIADMVSFQVDKISPFPVDQLAIAHEILETGENSALVLMAAAKRKAIDAVGDAFKKQRINIHSIDARVLGWLQLLRDKGKFSGYGCEIIIIDDGIDFALVVLLNGNPVAFRSLHSQIDDMHVVDELDYEISYTLTTLDTEYDVPAPNKLHYWSSNEVPAALRLKLGEKTGLIIEHDNLSSLPPLSEGIAARSLYVKSRIELIPQEWIDLQVRKALRKKFTLISSSIAAVWIAVLLVFFGIYKTRDMELAKVRGRAQDIEPAAREALQNRRKLEALKVYTDRSDSSIECLREVTLLLPIGDIEFTRYNYTKEKGVTLHGSAANDSMVYDYFNTLKKSGLFESLKDESVSTKPVKGVRRAFFSVTLVLNREEKS